MHDLNQKLKQKDQECLQALLKIKILRRSVRQHKLNPINKSANFNSNTLRSQGTEIGAKYHKLSR